MQDIQCSAYKI